MKRLIVLLLLTGKMAWPQSETGSVIFFYMSDGEITMSADSKTISVQSREVKSDCKISAFGDKFAFQIAGFIKDDIPNGWDVRLIARKIWQSESVHEPDAFKLVQAVSDKWMDRTRRIYSDPEYIRYRRHTHPNSPVIANVVFAATDKSGQLIARAVDVYFDMAAFDSAGRVDLGYRPRYQPPGWIAAGSSEIINEFMLGVSPRAKKFMNDWRANNAKLTPSSRNAELARKMIEFSIRLHPHPEEIGPPVDVLQIMPKTGIHWVQGEAGCAAQ